MALLVLLVVGRSPSPFNFSFSPGGTFPFAHPLPHLLGTGALIACRFLAFGNDHKGAWTFAAAPESSLRPFAAGVHAALWTMLV